MVPFRNYVNLSEGKQREKGSREEALESAGRYLSRMVDLDNQEPREEQEGSPSSSLMYNMDALTALHNYFLGAKYPHVEQFSHLGTEEAKRKNMSIVSQNFPHLVPHIENKIHSWG